MERHDRPCHEETIHIDKIFMCKKKPFKKRKKPKQNEIEQISLRFNKVNLWKDKCFENYDKSQSLKRGRG